MKAKMILMISTLCTLLCLGVGLCRPLSLKAEVITSVPSLKTTLLMNSFQKPDFLIHLFYGNLTQTDWLYRFEVTPEAVTLEAASYTSYPEGFIPQERNRQILALINDARSKNNSLALTTYTHYLEAAGYGFVTTSDNLKNLYIIDLHTLEVWQVLLDNPYALQAQQIYHINKSEDTFYLLTFNTQTNSAYWYALDRPTLKLIKSQHILTNSHLTKKEDFALDTKGQIFLLNGDAAITIHNEQGTSKLMLDFIPERVFYSDDKLYAFYLSDLFLTYAVFDAELSLLSTGYANLPNQLVSLLDCQLDNHHLYTITADTQHPIYRYYITVYDINTQEIIYCLGLRENENYTLLGSSIHPLH